MGREGEGIGGGVGGVVLRWSTGEGGGVVRRRVRSVGVGG